MKDKERRPVYVEGQEVQVSVTAPEWIDARVVDLTPPKTRHLTLRFIEIISGAKPMAVKVDEGALCWADAKIRIYKGSGRIRPKSVRQK